jgi:two-component system cell cycle sensor histidine kinase/response regulator CckA
MKSSKADDGTRELREQLEQAQRTLAVSELKFRSLIDNLDAGVVVHAPDASVIVSNARANELFGLSSEQLQGRGAADPVWRFMRDDASSLPVEEYPVVRVLASGQALGDQVVGFERYGSAEQVWVLVNAFPVRDAAGQLLHVVVTFTDITVQRRAERALRESEELYRRLTETAQDMIWRVDLEGKVLFVNQAVETLLGYRAVDVLGLPLDRYMTPASAAAATEGAIAAVMADPPQRHYQIEIEYLHQDGSIVFGDARVNVIYGADGGPIAFEGISRDVTAQRRAAAEHERLAAELQQAQKMESVGRLAGGVAHDFNNMLSVILGHAELALEQLEFGQPLHADLLEIQRAAQHSADLTRQLLAFARKQTITPKVLDLNQVVGGMLKMLRRLIGEDIDLAWSPGSELPRIKIDPAQIDQTLANLCVNARDAIEDVGKVTIETAAVTFGQERCLDHPETIPGEYVLLAVSDDGCGMDEETLRQLFEPFFTTKEVGTGTGLGLAMVYGIVKQNGGLIDVESEPGRGSTFRIYLPVNAGRRSRPTTEGVESKGSSDHETILLVEDEQAILSLGQRMLETLGYRVLPASTPGEALRLAAEHRGEIQLLVTDVVMPEMNGRDLAKRLLSLHPGMRRLFMSGYTADVIAHHGVLDEQVHFIQKPFSRRQLAAKVREALEA